MGNLYLMTTIVDRKVVKRYLDFRLPIPQDFV